ncbi:hypothetical protein SPHINGOAX6_20376 [Sphingomonas sp. AX6]|nr:hypothetical protein SPHINGOAX6_20376 [Sphingomonas sp. AX6]
MRGEVFGDCSADPGCGTGDECGFAGKCLGHGKRLAGFETTTQPVCAELVEALSFLARRKASISTSSMRTGRGVWFSR